VLVVMGGSFAAIGGHNLLEPASLGRPVITGPSDHNIREELERLQAAGGLKQVPDSEALTRAIDEWLQQPQQAEAAGRKAREALQQGRHILDDYLEAIETYR